jgi:hypothetical protein
VIQNAVKLLHQDKILNWILNKKNREPLIPLLYPALCAIDPKILVTVRMFVVRIKQSMEIVSEAGNIRLESPEMKEAAITANKAREKRRQMWDTLEVKLGLLKEVPKQRRGSLLRDTKPTAEMKGIQMSPAAYSRQLAAGHVQKGADGKPLNVQTGMPVLDMKNPFSPPPSTGFMVAKAISQQTELGKTVHRITFRIQNHGTPS